MYLMPGSEGFYSLYVVAQHCIKTEMASDIYFGIKSKEGSVI